MAVYRESAPLWRRRLPLLIGAIIILVIVIIGAVLLTQPRTASTDSSLSAQQSLDTLSQSLDLFDIEYAKIRKGAAAAQTGAPGAIRKAADTLSSGRGILQPLNPTAFDRLGSLLTDLNNAVGTIPAPDVADTLSDANAQVVTLRAAIAR